MQETYRDTAVERANKRNSESAGSGGRAMKPRAARRYQSTGIPRKDASASNSPTEGTERGIDRADCATFERIGSHKGECSGNDSEVEELHLPMDGVSCQMNKDGGSGHRLWSIRRVESEATRLSC